MRKVVIFLLLIDFIMVNIMNLCGVNMVRIPYLTHPVFFVDVSKYPVKGVDVSEYQGNIDWNVLSGENIDFAYIKATKGSGYKDKKFSYNWENAKKTCLTVGAYLLFEYGQPGAQQAENFINSVPDKEGILPPAVDVELYGKDRDDPPGQEATIQALKELLDRLEKYYGKKPVIYATKKAYAMYIAGRFKDNPLWIRDPDSEPVLPDGRKWTFWQYNNDGELKGYGGESRFIDLNVFNGTREEFYKFIN